jgi:hypothetical protein
MTPLKDFGKRFQTTGLYRRNCKKMNFGYWMHLFPWTKNQISGTYYLNEKTPVWKTRLKIFKEAYA